MSRIANNPVSIPAGVEVTLNDTSLSVKGIYNSNLLLRDGNNEVWGNWVTPAVKFKGATESLSIEGDSNE